jgi:hypothetical protein
MPRLGGEVVVIEGVSEKDLLYGAAAIPPRVRVISLCQRGVDTLNALIVVRVNQASPCVPISMHAALCIAYAIPLNPTHVSCALTHVPWFGVVSSGQGRHGGGV